MELNNTIAKPLYKQLEDQLKEEISKQMRQEYQIDFHTKLSENALYNWNIILETNCAIIA